MRGNEKAVIGALFAVVVSLIAFVWSAQASAIASNADALSATRERLAVVETKGEARELRLQRIEAKIDLLLERVPVAGSR